MAAPTPAETFLGPNLVDKDGVKFSVSFDTESIIYLGLAVLGAVILGGVLVSVISNALKN